MQLVVGIDCSTTAVKAIAWSPTGKELASARAPLSLQSPGPEAYEQDATSWWSGCCAALRELSGRLGRGHTRQLSGLCVTHQRETVVVTDGAGEPRHPALSWMDARGHAHVEKLVARLGAEQLHRLSGKPACVTPSLYKLAWLFEQQPALARGERRILDVGGFLAWRLTGRCATSLASADPTGLVEMERRDWSEALLAAIGLSRAELPELVEPGAPLGALTDQAAHDTGLPSGLPIFAGAGDGQAAGLGAGIDGPDRAYLNLGTAIVSGVVSDSYLVDRAFRTLYAAEPGRFFLETDLKGGTFTLEWLLERLLSGRAAAGRDRRAGLEAAAARLAPGAEGLLLVPYFNGVMNPYWDDAASGLLFGLRGHHRPAHVYRAILEGIAFEQRLHLAALERASGTPVREVVVLGGGAASALWCQILADVLARPVLRAETEEATALGAGVLAMVGAGVHSDLDSARQRMTRTGVRFKPGQNQPRYLRLFEDVYRELYPALRTPMRRLAELCRGDAP